MLVLTRRSGERIWIGDNICIEIITITRGGRDSVKVGISAPRDVPVHREELIYDQLTPDQKLVAYARRPKF